MSPIKLIYSNINGFNNRKEVVYNYIQNNQINALLCVETKHKADMHAYGNWSIIQQKGNVVNNNIRGGCLAQCDSKLQMGRSNPPRINNPLNNCLHFTLPFNKSKLHIFLVYIHPHSLIEDTIFVKASLYEHVMIVGDFNVNQQKKRQIQTFLDNSNFTQINTLPTFIMPNNPSSTPDILLCTENIKNNITVDLTPDLGSDHLAMEISFDMQLYPANTNKNIMLNINKCNIEAVNKELSAFISQKANISENYIEEFNTKLSKLILDNSPPLKEKTYNYTLPPFILRLIKQKRQLYRQIKFKDTIELKTIYNNLNKDIHKLVQQYKEDKWINTCNNINKLKGKNYWQEIRKLSKYKTNLAATPEIIYNNATYCTAQDKANAFAEYYNEVFKAKYNADFDEDHFQNISTWYNNYFTPNNTPTEIPDITEEEYDEVLATGKNTAPGYDCINRNILRQLTEDTHKEILKMYNFCLQNSYFPKSWKQGIAVTIPKPGHDHSSPQNYRPIVLLPTIGKNFEKIIKNRLQHNIGNRIPNHQYGFKQGTTTVHPLLILVSNVQACSIAGWKSAATFLDIKKAFDTVWHKGLLYKLSVVDCPGYLLWMVKVFLENRQIKVRINGIISSPLTPEQGLPQGSPLSPWLYNIYGYDMVMDGLVEEPNRHTYVLQFADDTAILSHGKNLSTTIETLQQGTDMITHWLNKWRLEVNPQKCRMVIFHHALKDTSPTISISNNTVKPQSSVRYLGITVDSKTNFNQHTKQAKRQVITRAMHFRSLTYKNKGINLKTATHIYKMICRPLIEYGHILYKTCRRPALHNIETAERTTLRKLTKIRHPMNPIYNPSNNLLYEQTKIQPILCRFNDLTRKASERILPLVEHQIVPIQNLPRRHRRFPEKPLYTLLKDEAEQD